MKKFNTLLNTVPLLYASVVLASFNANAFQQPEKIIAGSDMTFYPYEYMEQWKYMLPEKKKIILICEHGNLSMRAAKRLDQEGVEAYSLIGGMHAWKE